ncbi:MAG: hypothetical protein CM1200mP2_04410 [Planctomycetaceae bacterium]|nr:MAG: hypothetical protein CM1200mP2_04410 [Planctomycetaceae bacterium]
MWQGALKAAKHVHKGYYGIATISHMCREKRTGHTASGMVRTSSMSTSRPRTSRAPGAQFAGPLGIDARKRLDHLQLHRWRVRVEVRGR